MTVRQFLDDYHEARLLLARGQSFTIGRFGREIKSREDFSCWFLEGLNRKINTLGKVPMHGRKYSRDYFMACWRDQRNLRQLREQRIACHQFETREVSRRLGHLLSTRDD